MDAGHRSRAGLIFLIVAVSMMMVTSGCSKKGRTVSVGKQKVELRTIRILATNDIHGALNPSLVEPPVGPGRLGGIEYLAGMIRTVRDRDRDNTIVVDAGDCFQGDYAVNASEGSFCTDYFNLVGYSARTIGNHEFDYLDVGPDLPGSDPRGALKRMLENARQPLVLANVRQADGSFLHRRLYEYRIIDVGGLKIGITGVLTPSTPSVSNRVGSADLVFEQPVDALKRVLPKMRQAGAGVVVVLSHLTGLCADRADLYSPGEKPCQVGGELAEIQSAFTPDDIDIIVSGHDHVMLRGDGPSIPVLESMGLGIFIGQAEIDVDPGTGRRFGPVRVLPHIPVCVPGDQVPAVCSDAWPGFAGFAEPDEGVRDLRLAAEKAVAAQCADIVAEAEVDLPFFRGTEPPLANLAADLLRELGDTVDAEGNRVPADFAFLNRGSTRGSLAAGPVSVCEIARVWPFTGPAVVVSMTGAELLRMMYFLVDDVKKAPIISGMRAVRDEGGPIRIFDSTGVEIQADTMYRVVTTKYMVDGGDRLDEYFVDFPADRISVLPDLNYRDGFIRILRERRKMTMPDTSRYKGITRK